MLRRLSTLPAEWCWKLASHDCVKELNCVEEGKLVRFEAKKKRRKWSKAQRGWKSDQKGTEKQKTEREKSWGCSSVCLFFNPDGGPDSDPSGTVSSVCVRVCVRSLLVCTPLIPPSSPHRAGRALIYPCVDVKAAHWYGHGRQQGHGKAVKTIYRWEIYLNICNVQQQHTSTVAGQSQLALRAAICFAALLIPNWHFVLRTVHLTNKDLLMS